MTCTCPSVRCPLHGEPLPEDRSFVSERDLPFATLFVAGEAALPLGEFLQRERLRRQVEEDDGT